MHYQAILFDLDGTLLPMDYEEFTRGYFGLLAKAAAPCGYTKETLIPAMWKGVAAMVKNDGRCPNKDAFWSTFAGFFGEQVYEHIPVFDAFYSREFHGAKACTQPTPLAAEAVALAHDKADTVVLATNSIFPRVAVDTRLGWAGVSPDAFDLITDYENSTTCKPNPAYYREICEKLSLDPARCLMVGNNAQEDIEAATACGMDTYLITDCLINEKDTLPDGPHGTFAELIAYLKAI